MLAFLEYIFLVTYLFCTLRSIYFLVKTLNARIDPSVYKQPGLVEHSQIFFGTICNEKYGDYVQKSAQYSESDLISDLQSQIYVTSKIASLKFKCYGKAVRGFILSLTTLLFYLILHIYQS
jgi:hypothetical protein